VRSCSIRQPSNSGRPDPGRDATTSNPIWRDINGNKVVWNDTDWNNFPTQLLDYSDSYLLNLKNTIDALKSFFGIATLGTFEASVKQQILNRIAPSLIPVNRVDATGKALTTSAITEHAASTTGNDKLVVKDTGDSIGQTGQLTVVRSGLGMGGTLTYDQLENVNISLSDHADALTIVSTHSGQTTVNLDGGDDSAAIRSISGATFVNGGNGNDTFHIGSLATTSSDPDGVADNIGATLSIDGGTGTDVATVEDTQDSTGDTGELTNNSLTGIFGANGSLSYSTLETLNVNLGTGADTLNIESTQSGQTNVNTAQARIS